MSAGPDYLLDASALIALIRSEPGAEKVAALLSGAVISAVNLAEVVTKLVQRGAEPDAAMHMLSLLQIPVLPWDEESALNSRRFAELADEGFSLGDRACMSEAMRHSKTRIVTADRLWKNVNAISKRLILIR